MTCSKFAPWWRGVSWHLLAYSLGAGGTLAFGCLLLHNCLGLVQVRGQLRGCAILLRFRHAPLHMLEILLYSAFFVAWLVYRVL